MSRKLKLATKLLAIFLSVLFVVQVLPMQTMAASFSGKNNDEKIAMPTNEANSEKILYEVMDKRDKNTKVYKKADGTYTAIVSPMPLHYNENNEWKEIDNTLKVNEDGNYTNTANSMKIKLPSNISSGEQISVSDGEYSVSFSFNEANNRKKAKVNNNKKVSMDLKTDDLLDAIDTSSTITYEDVMQNTDVEYKVSGTSLKENIVIKKWSAVKKTYSFTIKATGLSATKEDDNSVSFTDSNGDIVFEIPAPYMIDSNNVLCEEVGVKLVLNNDLTYTLTYTPNRDWLQVKERKYPVVLDPVVVGLGMDILREAAVTSDDPDVAFADSTFCVAANGIMENSDGTSKFFEAETYAKIQDDVLRTLLRYTTIVEAQLVGAGGASGKIVLKEIEGSCDLSTVTYNTRPTLSNDIVDYYTAPPIPENNSDGVLVHFNVTRYLTDILFGGKANNGLAMVVTDDCPDNSTMFLVGNAPRNGVLSSVSGMGLIINYIDTNGYDSRYDYHSQPAGRAGTVYINDFSRQLFLTRNDLALDGNIMPVNLSFMYNSGIMDYSVFLGFWDFDSEEPQNSAFIYGDGWCTNYNRAVYINDLGQDFGAASIGYITENGTMLHFTADISLETGELEGFKEEKEDILGETGYTVELLETPENYNGNSLEYIQVTRPDGNVERFDTYGRLITVTNKDYPTQQIRVNYVSDLSNDTNFFAIDYISDGVGRKYDFTYDETTGLLSKVVCKTSDNATITAGSTTSALKTTYTYTTTAEGKNLLASVAFADGKAATYEYDAADNLSSVINLGVFKYSYNYDTFGRVIKVTEFARSTTLLDPAYTKGNHLEIIADGPCQTKFIDSAGQAEVYQYDGYGKPIKLYNDNGGYLNIENSGSNSNTIISNANYWHASSENLLENHSFEQEYSSTVTNQAAVWYDGVETSAFVRTNTQAHTGDCSYYVHYDTSLNDFFSQSIPVENNGSYTFSCYAKAGVMNTLNHMAIDVTAYSADNVSIATARTEIYQNNLEWSRYSATIDIPSDAEAEYIVVKFGAGYSGVNFYVDDVQLERQVDASAYNILNNGSLNYLTSGVLNSWTTDDEYDIISETINGKTQNAFEFDGGMSCEKSMSQTVQINGSAGDVYSFGGWFKGNIVEAQTTMTSMVEMMLAGNPNYFNFTDDRFARIKMDYTYTAGEGENTETHMATEYCDFNAYVTGWQYASKSVALLGDCDEITISVEYVKHPSSACFAELELSFDEDACVVEPVEEEPVTPPVEEPQEELTYCVCGENCNYGLGCPCTCASEETCTCSCCHRSTDVQYDSFGNLTSVSMANMDFNQLLTLLFSRNFSSTGNYQTSSTSFCGNSEYYSYNENNGVLNSLTDARNSVTQYTYNALGALTIMKKDVSNLVNSAESINTSYGYSNDRLITIGRNGYYYHISYDKWNNITQICVGLVDSLAAALLSPQTFSIVSYTYGSGANRNRVESVSYGNNCTINYQYNAHNQVTGVSFDGGEHWRYVYTYDRFGSLVSIFDSETYRTVTFKDGLVSITDTSGLSYSASYDLNGNLVENYGGYSVTAKNYDTDVSDNVSVSSSAFTSNNAEIGIRTTTDKFWRTRSKLVSTKDLKNTENTASFAAVNTEYTYKVLANSTATAQIDTVKNTISYGENIALVNQLSNFTLAYDYDINGNITAEYAVNDNNNRVLRYRYTYDEAEQLVRVDDNVNSKTIVYQYNKGGNRVSTKEYAYTLTNTLGTAVTTVGATYLSIFAWHDIIEEYNGIAVNYDHLGNVTSYNGGTFTWENRLLQQYQNTAQNLTVSYQYDYEGLRTFKHFEKDGKYYLYYYVWVDGVLSGVKLATGNVVGWGGTATKTVKIIYDGKDPVGLLVNGTDEYLFVKNIQGDVLKIVDSNGVVMVEYSYDAWGKRNAPVYNTQYEDEAKLIDAFNPVGYRGYIYDAETGMYYLQSRYYNPEWGRFISSDIYLETGTGVLGSNVFTYCDNNCVNKTDPEGTFAKEYHYDTTYDFSSVVFSDKYAKIIAQGSKSVDDRYSPLNIFSSYYQSFHFNVNIGTSLPDSRIQRCEEFFKKGIKKLKDAKSYKDYAALNNGIMYLSQYEQMISDLEEAYKYFGMAIHPIQDMIAHSGPQGQKEGYIYGTVDSVTISFIALPEQGVGTVFYHHLLNGDYNADDPSKIYYEHKREKDYYAKINTAICIFAVVVLSEQYGFYYY